jgi:low temperature requirement protein LtrA
MTFLFLMLVCEYTLLTLLKIKVINVTSRSGCWQKFKTEFYLFLYNVMHKLSSKTWWGAPKKFTTEKEERKISWLELFYDLVYVIAISTITHSVAQQFSLNALLDYFYLFVIIFWGWLNGSMYHDLHGSDGLRTKLMTLWQMVIVSALVITLHSHTKNLLFNTTIVLLIMQIYITYLWWSVGLYDKEHRRLSKPFTIIYLVSLGFIFTSLFVDQPFVRILFYITLVLNCSPPFVSYFFVQKRISALSLSSSMTERLGLFTTILFGEVVLGVINGIIAVQHLDVMIWIQFGLAIGIVFSLWWLFFTIVSDRQCKTGLLNSSIFELLFIPTLIGLGLLGASFNDLFKDFNDTGTQGAWLTESFGFSIALFLLGIWAMMSCLNYPDIFLPFKRIGKRAFLFTAILIIVFTCLRLKIELVYHLLIILLVLIGLIAYLNGIWYRKMKNPDLEKITDQ